MNKNYESVNPNSRMSTNGCLMSKSIKNSRTTFGKPLAYPNPNCTHCPNHEIDTWPHLLSTCAHPRKKPSHSPPQQSTTPISPHTPIEQTHKVLYPSKCRQPTRLAQGHHNPRMVHTMHMPSQHMRIHGLAKTY